MAAGKIKMTGKFLVNEIMDYVVEAGLTIVTLLFGINFFDFADNWIQAARLTADKMDISNGNNFVNEAITIGDKIQNNFPFSLITPQNVQIALIFGITLIVVGIIIKIITAPSKSEFVKDLGKIILFPGIIGLISLVYIQVVSARSISDALGGLIGTSNVMQVVSSAEILMKSMGHILIVGIILLVLGIIFTVTIKKIRGPVLVWLLGKSMIFIGTLALVFYAGIRILAIPAVNTTHYGEMMLKSFIFSWAALQGGFITFLIMMEIGFIFYRYGKILQKRERNGRFKAMRINQYARPMEQ